jgi:adenosine deaminase
MAVKTTVSNEKERSEARARLRALPKVDLHRHLEGSLRLQTLSDFAKEHGIDLPSYDIEYLRRFATVADGEHDFYGFLEKFRFLRRFYPTQAAVQRVAYEAVADAATDNIKYLELRFNPVALSRLQGFRLDEVTLWVCDAVAGARRDLGVRAALILQVGREESLETASQIAELALAHRSTGVVGIDLAGDEATYPAGRFSRVFRRVREEGLGVTVHAGEARGAESIVEAIDMLGAQRIGHGVSVVRDEEVVRMARQGGITFEVCPTSNLQTGVVSSLALHPLPDMLNLGLRATVNTDDPSICDTTLTDEYVVAVLEMGITIGQIKRTILTAIEGSFQPLDERQRLTEWFRQEFADL